MSSMRNAVARRNHKERAQPREREKWGILEKHKVRRFSIISKIHRMLTWTQDYSLRAKDYSEKKKRLKILRQKAAERNPDEFHFGMMSSKTHNGGQKLADRSNLILSHDAVKLLKTQDAGYLRTMAQKTRLERKRFEQEYILREGRGAEVLGDQNERSDRQHIVFVSSKEEQKTFDPEKFFETTVDGLNRIYNRPRRKSNKLMVDLGQAVETKTISARQEVPVKIRRADKEEDALKENRSLRKRRKREQDARSSKLKALRTREKDLLVAEQELELQRARMSNSIGGVNKAGVKFKMRERKK